MSKPAIEVDNVSMKFNLSKEKVDSLKDYVIKMLKKEIHYNEFWALKNISCGNPWTERCRKKYPAESDFRCI